MYRRLLRIDTETHSWRLETLRVASLEQNIREDYFVLSGETLCQYLLRRSPGALIVARGPLPYLSGNKVTVGYISPLTGVPHYSFVGGRAAVQLLNLGLDAIYFTGVDSAAVQDSASLPVVVIGGRAPDLTVDFKSADMLPSGQRSAFYHLLEIELHGRSRDGCIFTLGEAARLGYKSANIAVDAIYHAGRGGVGNVFARFAAALVLRGEPLEPPAFFAGLLASQDSFVHNPNTAIASQVERYCARLSRKSGGTIAKLYATGGGVGVRPTLPAFNARSAGYVLADLGSPRLLKSIRQGQTGCHWCQVDCRHYHWVPADYAPSGQDMLLDDFEPAYAIFAMLGLVPESHSPKAKLSLLDEVERGIVLPVEQMGCDVMNVGLGLAALFEGIAQGLIPSDAVPDFMMRAEDLDPGTSVQRLETAVRAVELLRTPVAAQYPALRAVGDGPQALAEDYPGMQDIVFTSGKGTLGNAGHGNALWTFMMPFSRFFGHYVGQVYKIDVILPPPGSKLAAYQACFAQVVQRMLSREFFWLLSNTLSMCAFTFVIFSQDGKGESLSDDDLLVRLLRNYGISTNRVELEWFAQAFWAQSMDLKYQFGWRPPSARDFPKRVYELLSITLERSVTEVQMLMELLISEWLRQSSTVLERFGYPGWSVR